MYYEDTHSSHVLTTPTDMFELPDELKFTPETAFDFVNRVTNIEWNQKKLNINNVSTELNLWKEQKEYYLMTL